MCIRDRYGTERANAYKILEDTLNLKDVRIYDKSVNENGDEIRVPVSYTNLDVYKRQLLDNV